MPLMRFSKGAAMFDATPIENLFLLEYLPSAPDGCLRVYLYARMMCLHPELGETLEDIARALNMEESAVFNAFSYWEQQGLVERLSDNPPTYEIKPLYSGASAPTAMDRDYYVYRDFNSDLLRAFGEDALLESRHYQQANDWLNVMGMEQDAVLAILRYELRQKGGKRPDSVFKRANRRVIELADRGMRTKAEVERGLAQGDHVHALAQGICNRLSIRRAPTEDELICAHRWTEEWQLTDEEIYAACAETTKSRNPSFSYLDAILKGRSGDANACHETVKAALRELGVEAQPTPDQKERCGEWFAEGFDRETILLAAVHCARRRNNDFEALDALLKRWKERGILRKSAAEGTLARLNRLESEFRAILDQADLRYRLTDDALELYADWKRRVGPEMILCAAEMARSTRGSARGNMEMLIDDWEARGIRTPAEARRTTAPPKTADSKSNYAQRVYTDADFGADFYDNEVLPTFEEGKA